MRLPFDTYNRFMMRAIGPIVVLALGIGLIAVVTACQSSKGINTTSRLEEGKVASSECGTWKVLTKTNFDESTATGGAHGVTAISKNDVWIVGTSSYQQDKYRPLLMHWDGKGLSDALIATIDPKLTYVQIEDVAGVSSDDVWAVGQDMKETIEQPAILHWNGRTWKFVDSPQIPAPRFAQPNETDRHLYAVSAVTKDDIWAVGHYTDDYGLGRTLAEHWDGSQWKRIDSPNVSKEGYNVLYDVVAISTNDVWAVGSYSQNTSSINGNFTSDQLMMHWNGVRWEIDNAVHFVNIANGVLGYHSLRSISASKSNSIWAIGDNLGLPLVERWDGKSWKVVSSPNPGLPYGNHLSGITAISDNDIWVVGSKSETDNYDNRTMVLHWNGKYWIEASAPNPSNEQVLLAVAAVATNDLWAVGVSTYSMGDAHYPMVAHFVGSSNLGHVHETSSITTLR